MVFLKLIHIDRFRINMLLYISSNSATGEIRFEKEQDSILLPALRLHVTQMVGEMSLLRRMELFCRGIIAPSYAKKER